MAKHNVMCPVDTKFSSTSTQAILLTIIWLVVSIVPITSSAQIGDYQKYSDISSSEYYDFDIVQDIKYGVGKTNYQKLGNNGSYSNVSQINLELDLFVPNTPASEGKRAVIIMIPGSGRGGCRDGVRYLTDGSINTANGCDQKTLLTGSNVTQEGRNYNHLNNPIASQYAKRGLIVASVNTRYNYQHTDFAKDGSNRWYQSSNGTQGNTNPATLLNLASAHLEYMVVDLKRVMRWLTANADTYNIDPNYIFITGASGAAKMAALTGIANEDQLIVDDPANINVTFETANNNWGIRNSTPGIKGVILKKGDTNGLSNLKLMDTMSANTDSFMFWTGTADKSILQGMSEVMEEKCEILQTCSAQLYSLPNKTHTSASSAKFLHPESGEQNSTTHIYDFMVNAIHKDSENLPVISISQSAVSFDESVGNAQIRIVRSGNTNSPITFTVSADQMREVTRENGSSGTFDLITNYVAKSSNSDGLVMYNESTGYIYEDAFGGDLRKTSDKVVRHTSGKGEGEYTEISSADNQYHNIDFTGKTQILTMAAGQSSINFNVAIESDSLHEQNECFNVRLLNAYGATIGNSVETITIRDDDSASPSSNGVCSNRSYNGNFEPAPVISLSSAQQSVTEGGSRSLVISSSGTVTENISVNYRTIAGSASTDDFRWVDSVAVIPAGQNQTTISIQTTEDNRVEQNETFTVNLMSIVGGDANIGSVSSTVMTILDDDEMPVITIGPNNKSVNEGNSVSVTVSSSLVLSQNISFEYQTKVLSATVDDFTWKLNTATIAAGSSSVDISVATTEDFLVEGTEVFTVNLNRITAGSASIGSNDESRISIIDNDSLAKISIGPSGRTVNEGSTAVLTIQSDRNLNQAISVQYQTMQGSATIDDFVWVRKSAQIPAGQSSVDIEIDTTSDLNVEGNENFHVELRSITAGNAEIGTDKTSVITIRDNDVLPSISFSAATKSVTEGNNVTLTIESDRAASEALSIEYQTRVDTATTADFKWQLRTAVIPLGETSTNIVIETTEDQIDEPNETFTVTLNSVNGEASIGTPKSTRITILDDDSAVVLPNITITPSVTNVAEGNNISLTIAANKNVSESITVEYQTAVDTATVDDFKWTKSTATIPAGSKNVNIVIRTEEDSLVEANETFNVVLNEVVNGSANLGSSKTSSITIIDDDVQSTIRLSAADVSVSEGNKVNLTLISNYNVSGTVAVEYQTKVISASTDDFVWISKVATIPSGSKSVDISIQTREDSLVESDETFEIVLNKIRYGSAELGFTTSTIVKILDDDTAPKLSFTESKTVVEEGTKAQLIITTDRETQNDVTVEYQTKVASATVDDFVWIRNTAVIPKGKTKAVVSIQTRHDKEKEEPEHFTVNINKVTGGWARVAAIRSTEIEIVEELCEMFVIPLRNKDALTVCL